MRALVFALLAVLGLAAPARAQEEAPAPSVVLVTIDGYRWEELFRGADASRVRDPQARAHYVDAPDRAAVLTPFLLSFREAGALIGDRDAGSCAHVSNEYWFSYPGYAEMMAGRPNPHARSNQNRPNADVTVLERLLQRPEFQGQVRVFAEWDVMPGILNTARSNIPVFVPPDYDALHDPQVMAAAREILADPPRVLWVALGDTDNRAHEGKYEAYLDAAHAADAFLSEIWQAYQANPRTAGRTTMIVTADHGRGAIAGDRWRGHGSGRWRHVIVPGLRREGSDAIFIGVRGPGVSPGAGAGYAMGSCASVSQIAATVLAGLGLQGQAQPDMAPPLDVFAH